MFVALIIFFAVPFMILMVKILYNLEATIKFEALKTYQDLKTSNHMQKENLNVYRSLDEGIMTIKDNQVDFTNEIAEDIIMDLEGISNRVISPEVAKKQIFD